MPSDGANARQRNCARRDGWKCPFCKFESQGRYWSAHKRTHLRNWHQAEREVWAYDKWAKRNVWVEKPKGEPAYTCKLCGLAIEDPRKVLSQTTISRLRVAHMKSKHERVPLSSVWQKGTARQRRGIIQMGHNNLNKHIAKALVEIKSHGHQPTMWDWVQRPKERENGKARLTIFACLKCRFIANAPTFRKLREDCPGRPRTRVWKITKYLEALKEETTCPVEQVKIQREIDFRMGRDGDVEGGQPQQQ